MNDNGLMDEAGCLDNDVIWIHLKGKVTESHSVSQDIVNIVLILLSEFYYFFYFGIICLCFIQTFSYC